MKKIAISLVMFLLCSCTTMHYGNHAAMPKSKEDYLVRDAVSQMRKVYPPAKNTFYLSQRAYDVFGVKLLSALRKQGYGIAEEVKNKQQANFFYVLDEYGFEQSKSYRLSLFVGNQALNRAYVLNRGAVTPITPWAHKER